MNEVINLPKKKVRPSGRAPLPWYGSGGNIGPGMWDAEQRRRAHSMGEAGKNLFQKTRPPQKQKLGTAGGVDLHAKNGVIIGYSLITGGACLTAGHDVRTVSKIR